MGGKLSCARRQAVQCSCTLLRMLGVDEEAVRVGEHRIAATSALSAARHLEIPWQAGQIDSHRNRAYAAPLPRVLR